MEVNRGGHAVYVDPEGRRCPVAAWLHASERSWAYRLVAQALGAARHEVHWYRKPESWLSHDARVRLVVCSSLLDPSVHVTIQAAAQRPGRVVVATTDLPQRVHVLLPTGAHDAYCLPEQQSLFEEKLQILVRHPDAGAWIEGLAKRCDGALAAGLRLVARCVGAGAPAPPRSIGVLAARIGCSRGYLSALASGQEIPLLEILKCAVLLRAVHEHASTAGGWDLVAEALGYADASGLRKAFLSMLGSGTSTPHDLEDLLVKRLADLTGARL